MAEIAPKKLLAVEDDKLIAEIISKVGILAGFETRISNNEFEFKTAYREFKPNVIILDIMMPGMDGFEVLQFLKEKSSKACIVIVSGENEFRKMAETMGKSYGLHIEGNIPKPLEIDALKNTLKKLAKDLDERDICGKAKQQTS